MHTRARCLVGTTAPKEGARVGASTKSLSGRVDGLCPCVRHFESHVGELFVTPALQNGS